MLSEMIKSAEKYLGREMLLMLIFIPWNKCIFPRILYLVHIFNIVSMQLNNENIL